MGGLKIITVWRGSQLIGVAPLYINSGKGSALDLRTIRFISTGEDEYEETCPDYMNVLCLPGDEKIISTEVWREISTMEWDYLEFLDIPLNSPLLLASTIQSFSCGSCLIANISGGFDAYINSMHSSRRQKTRYMLREGERAMVKFEVVGLDRASKTFNELISLHQERWAADGKAGVFAAQRFVEFHKSLIQNWIDSGRVILARLSLDSEAIAVLYGFVNNKKFDFYQCGVKRDAKLPLQSPGNLANLLLIKTLDELGFTEYDFLRGSSLYKNSLATCENMLSGIRLWRMTPRAIAFQTTQLPFKIIRRGCNILNSSKKALSKGVSADVRKEAPVG
jgi:hypothetical protein